MALTICLCQKGQRSFLQHAVEYTPAVKTAAVFDALLAITLLVVGILAIIGSNGASAQWLQGIGTIGNVGGGLMIAGAVVLGLLDLVSDNCFVRGFSPEDELSNDPFKTYF
ncbi:hypothetical protein ACFLR2_02285 [Chlamydiota bacterium]